MTVERICAEHETPLLEQTCAYPHGGDYVCDEWYLVQDGKVAAVCNETSVRWLRGNDFEGAKLDGRQKRGFAIGSRAARQEATAEPGPPRKRRGGWPVDHEKALLEPAWVRGEVLADQGKRFRDRDRARKAAVALGRDVPEWARTGRHTITREHRERIRDAALRRRTKVA